MKKSYPVYVHKDPGSSFGVSFPDLPGCISAGDTLEEAVENSKEAASLWIETAREHDVPVEEPSSLEQAKELAKVLEDKPYSVVLVEVEV